MDEQPFFELATAGELKAKYGLTAENRPMINLDRRRVPEALRPLIPYAEVWGIADDLIRHDLVRKTPRHVALRLKDIVERYDDLLDEWLAGPEASSRKPTPEYVAFSAMRIAADSV
jgi:hypothetical protein